MGTAILGTGRYVPERRLGNRELVERGLDTSDAWIVEHTGIRERRIAAANEATSDLAVKAAQRALEAAELDPAAIELIVCATSTPDHPLPATASLVQHRLGCTCGAMDLNAGCSGFVQALLAGFAFQGLGTFRHVLVIGADTYSRLVNERDRGAAVFFGDGAGAVVLGPSTDPEWLLSAVSGSDGSQGGMLEVPAGGSRLPATVDHVLAGQTKLHMDGRGVRRFVEERVPELVREVVARAGLRMDQVDLVVPHQANLKLLRALATRLELPESRMLLNVDRYGNTASASVAIALNEAVESGRVRPGANLVLVGFGAGLAWSGLCLRWGRT